MIVGAPILLIYFQIQGGSYSEEEEGACKIVLKKLKLGVLSNIHHLWVWIIYTIVLLLLLVLLLLCVHVLTPF